MLQGQVLCHACIDPCQQLQYAVFETSGCTRRINRKRKRRNSAHMDKWRGSCVFLCWHMLHCETIGSREFMDTHPYWHHVLWSRFHSCMAHGTSPWTHGTCHRRRLSSICPAEQTVKLSNGQAIEVVKFSQPVHVCVCSMSSIYIFVNIRIWYVCVCHTIMICNMYAYRI